MLEKRPMAGKDKQRSAQKCQTIIRRADGTTWDFPRDNPDPIEIAKALKRRAQRRQSAARTKPADNAPRSAESIKERMRRGIAARERDASAVEPSRTPLPGAWTLDIQ